MLDDLLNVVLYLILTYHVQSTQENVSYLLLHKNKKKNQSWLQFAIFLW